MRQINIAGLIYNHCLALHKRYYRLFGKHIQVYQLMKHLTKLKRTKRFAYMCKLGSQAVQNIAERIDHAYTLFFANVKRKVKASLVCDTQSDEVELRTCKSVGFDNEIYGILENVVILSSGSYEFTNKGALFRTKTYSGSYYELEGAVDFATSELVLPLE